MRFENLCKQFDNNEVLKNVSADIKPGEVTAILGPSGSGKTTLLRCLNFLERANGGSIEFDGVRHDLKGIKKKDIAAIRLKTSFVFQNYNLFRNKTALQNVIEGLVVARKMDRQKAEEIGRRMLEKVGLSDRCDYYPYQLSGGQQQRVAIARALATSPEIIYLDEPTSALDPELIGEVLGVLRELADEGITMLIVTHEIEFARSVANHILFMDNGRIIKDCSAAEFFEGIKDERIMSFLQVLSN